MNDVRPLLGGSYISSQSQVGSGIVIFDPGGGAQGDLLYNNGSGYVLLPPGTNGYFLKTQGSGANDSVADGPANLLVRGQVCEQDLDGHAALK